MLLNIVALLVLLASSDIAIGQVLTTAETTGRGAQTVMISENHLFVDGARLNIAYGQYIWGASKHLDLYASLGSTNIEAQNQEWIGVGGNFNLLQVKKFDVSLFHICSAPINQRLRASTVLMNPAVIVSRGVNKTWTLYSGINSLFPVGARDRGLFTPLTREINIPAGVAVSRGKWAIFLESDIGHQNALGFGISRSL